MSLLISVLQWELDVKEPFLFLVACNGVLLFLLTAHLQLGVVSALSLITCQPTNNLIYQNVKSPESRYPSLNLLTMPPGISSGPSSVVLRILARYRQHSVGVKFEGEYFPLRKCTESSGTVFLALPSWLVRTSPWDLLPGLQDYCSPVHPSGVFTPTDFAGDPMRCSSSKWSSSFPRLSSFIIAKMVYISCNGRPINCCRFTDFQCCTQQYFESLMLHPYSQAAQFQDLLSITMDFPGTASLSGLHSGSKPNI